MVETSDEEEGKENDDPPGKSLEIVVGQVCFFCLHVQGLNQKEMSMEVANIDTRKKMEDLLKTLKWS